MNGLFLEFVHAIFTDVSWSNISCSRGVIVFRKLAAAWEVPRSLEYNSWLFTASCYLVTYEETYVKSIPLPSEDCTSIQRYKAPTKLGT